MPSGWEGNRGPDGEYWQALPSVHLGTRLMSLAGCLHQSCPWAGLTDGLGWVGSGHTKWTHGQLWSACLEIGDQHRPCNA